jgi:ABC-type sugar transport system permease subunit
MKKLLILAVATSLAIAGHYSSASAADQTKLVFWTFADWATGTQGDEIKRQVAAFEQANPDIAVEVDGKPSTDIIAGLIANGTAPGVDVVTTQYRASSLVQGNVLADLSAQWNASSADYKNQFTKAFVDILSKNGKFFGVPYTTTASVVYRNLDVLQKAGIDPATPITDWQDWLAQMQKVKASGNYAVANQMVEWFQLPLFLTAAIWLWMLVPQFGLFDQLTSVFGLGNVEWLSNPRYMIPGLVIVETWRSAGFNMVLFYAGLKAIPIEQREAARIDGANTLQEIGFVILPQLAPIAFIITINALFGTFQVFDLPWLLSKSGFVEGQGGAGGGLLFPVMQSVAAGFGSLRFGQAAAIGVVLLLLIIFVTTLMFGARTLLRRRHV